MRVETHNGRHLLCGGVLDKRYIKPGQVWANADGKSIVTVASAGEWVDYKWLNSKGEVEVHTKDWFSFQCRYFLVLDTPEIPKELSK